MSDVKQNTMAEAVTQCPEVGILFSLASAGRPVS